MTVQKRLWISFTVTFFCFVLFAVVSHSRSQWLDTFQEMDIHTHNVMTSIERLSSRLKDAETGQRGYLLTANEAYLVPYHLVLEQVPEILLKLEQSLTNQSEQQLRLLQIRHIVIDKFAELAETIRLHDSGFPEKALALVNTDVGQNMMDEIRVLINEMLAVENTRLSDSKAQLLKKETMSHWIGYANGINTLIVVALIAYLTSKSISKSYVELEEAKLSLANMNLDYENTLQVIPDCLIEFDAYGTVVKVNRAGEYMLMKNGSWLGSYYHNVAPEPLSQSLHEGFSHVRQQACIHTCESVVGSSETYRYYEITLNAKRDAFQEINGFVAIIRDITDKKHSEHRIMKLATYDPLTSLLNRRALLDKIKQVQEQSILEAQFFAVLFIDLNHFKELNDSRGHDYGDKVLKSVALRLRSSTREKDIIARLGGDEFVILLTNMHSREKALQESEAVATKVLRSINVPFKLPDMSHQLSCSIGVTVGGGSAIDTPENILKKADIAMYHVKKTTRTGWSLFNADIQQEVYEHNELMQDLFHAVHTNALCIKYQPIVDKYGQICAWEALLRWQHPTRGEVSPAEFIPIAEESQIIVELSEWVLHQAARQLALWAQDARTSQWKISVNISARHIKMVEFSDSILNILQAHGAKPSRLVLELTETLVLESMESTVDVIKKLSDQGISFSLDDFGTGYSSLSYLGKIPTDHLKIDRSFVEDIGVNVEKQTSIASLIINISKGLGQKVVAEGVEKEDQFNTLVAFGCDYFQGYYFGHPEFAEKIESTFLDKIPRSTMSGIA